MGCASVNRENRAQGGFLHSTYKAICCRRGVFTNAQGTHDFNMQLSVNPQSRHEFFSLITSALPHSLFLDTTRFPRRYLLKFPMAFHYVFLTRSVTNLKHSAEPMIKILTTGWERAFTLNIPNVLSQYARSAERVLSSFHKGVETQARANSAGIAGLAMLMQQLQTYGPMFRDIDAMLIVIINDQQREINRKFTPVIATSMWPVYEACENEYGEFR